jgi:glycine betaine/proline transport system substrate-binding protein
MRIAVQWLGLIALLFSLPAAADPASCAAPRFADIGWTDITATTAITARLVEGLGYRPKIQLLSVPVTYVALKNKDIDIFLGNWMPSMQADRQPYLDNHSVEVVRPNLEGAKYTLAVSQESWDAGLHSFADIVRFKDELDGKLYGLEAGNDGNRVVLDMIKDNVDGLSGFELVESSEQGMLAQLDRSIRQHKPIVFLGWEPHPMNTKFAMRYLDDPDNHFGPDNGAAQVFTNVRAGYLAECPNLGQLLQKLQFSLPIEDQVMGAILYDKIDPRLAAEAWLKANPTLWAPWLDGVTTLDGAPPIEAIKASLGSHIVATGMLGGVTQMITDHKIPIGAEAKRVVDAVTAHGRGVFDLISSVLGGLIDGLGVLLLWLPAPILILLAAGGAYALHRSALLALFIVLGLALILNQGYWREAVETFSLVLSATLICVITGVPLGIASAHRPVLYQVLRPVLDLMQTIPTFVYLIPTMVLFGLGMVPGLISTVIFAIAAPIRLTHLGISSVPLQLREAGEAFGATRTQLLFKIELPYALPTIMAGITQCIMLSLSMVVIATMVGAGGLGTPVQRALQNVDIAMGFEAGLAIVVLAIILDRVCKRPEARTR